MDFVIASAAEPQQLVEFAEQLVQKAMASGMFIFADTDVKFDQPQTEVVFDRDKLRSQGVDLSQAGQDLSTMLGGNYVNRFSIQGRSYKVIPQVKRVERLTPDQLSQIYVKGSADKLVPLSTFATSEDHDRAAIAEQISAAQCGAHSGRDSAAVPLDKALTFLEDQAKTILPQGFTVDYAGESRQLRVEGSKFLGTFLLSAILIYLVLAAQFESFRDPFIILAGSVPLAISGALVFSFLGFTTLNIYSQVGLDYAGRAHREERNSDRGVRQSLQETGQRQAAGDHRGCQHPAAPNSDDDGRNRLRPFPPGACKGPGAGARNSIGIMLVSGMIIGTVIHFVCGAVDLHAGGAHARARRPERR